MVEGAALEMLCSQKEPRVRIPNSPPKRQADVQSAAFSCLQGGFCRAAELFLFGGFAIMEKDYIIEESWLLDSKTIEFILVTVLIAITLIGINWYKYSKSKEVKEIKPEKQPVLDGPQGRKEDSGKVIRAVKSFASRNGYEVIVPGKISHGTAVADFDALVVGTFGVLAVYSIGYYGQVYGSEKDETWAQTTSRGRVTFKNPLTQAEAQARLVREVLFDHKIKSVPVEAVCVFPNSATELVVPRSTPVHRLKDFSAMLLKDKYTEDRKVDIDAVAKALRDAVEK